MLIREFQGPRKEELPAEQSVDACRWLELMREGEVSYARVLMRVGGTLI